jgi:hypothetical protein
MPRPFELEPGIEELLVAGKDARIALDPSTGLNKYGCPPQPDPELLAFGSSTASVISQAGYAAASRLHECLLDGIDTPELAWQRIRQELLSDVSDLAVDLAFVPSGTDAHALAVRLLSEHAPLTVVMVEESETGSGVRAAMASCHPEIKTMSLRVSDGRLRASDEIDGQATALAESALALGHHVLLVMVDQSKTGMISPSVACAMALSQRHSDRVSVLVDACQFRISSATLRAYLAQGFMIAITGSKFLTGPAFSAALMLPQGYAAEDCKDMGLLLRWEAALVEYRRFRALEPSRVIRIMETFGRIVRQRLQEDPRFELLPAPPLNRRPLVTGYEWDQLPSIFPFLLRHREGEPLTHEETHRIYRQLQSPEIAVIGGRRCQLGQPVTCGLEGSALRLALSARLISDAAQGMDRLAADAIAALDKTAYLIDRIRD